MNPRVLELLKTPEKFQFEDLKLFEEEIIKIPYSQSVRGLYLFGVHKFSPENYRTELTKTAAYTTDKKILYQFINKNIEEKNPEKHNSIEEIKKSEPVFNELALSQINKNSSAETILENGIPSEIIAENSVEIEPQKTNFVNEEKINEIQSEPENNTYVLGEVAEEEEEAGLSTENIINESDITNEEHLLESNSEVSFHGLQDFLPEVKMIPKRIFEEILPQPKPKLDKYNDEMQSLIAEVEAKMKTSKKTMIVDEEQIQNKDVNFTETEDFKIKKEEISEINEVQKSKLDSEKIENNTYNVWEPLDFNTQKPDSLLNRKEIENTEDVTENLNSENQNLSRVPEINMSFFSPTVSQIDLVENIEKNDTQNSNVASNVPTFINTWQSWLKLDKNEPPRTDNSKPETIDIKEKAIETFIENQPKISQLKEESNFVVKEKANDISHLMTETLAKLYVEQKLYSKAIKAYETLIQKHPEKESYFLEKIQNIKDSR